MDAEKRGEERKCNEAKVNYGGFVDVDLYEVQPRIETGRERRQWIVEEWGQMKAANQTGTARSAVAACLANEGRIIGKKN